MIDQPVHRRRVLFCTGYDPNGPGFFYNLFKREFERYCGRFGFNGVVSSCQTETDGVFSHWDVELRNGVGSGKTHYTLLNWDDLVNKYMRRSKLVTLLLKLVYDMDAVITGTIWRMTRLNWRFGLASVYPTLAVLGLLASGLGIASLVKSASQSWGLPLWTAYGLSALTVWGIFALGYYLLSRKCFLHLLITDGIFSMQHARGKRHDYVERVDQFARRLVDIVNQSNDDEVLVVGHSSGSFCAVEIVAQALRLEPALAEKGPRVSLLTVGANLPLIGCHPRATRFREDVALVATQKKLFWLEYQATEDLLNFPRFDPVRDLPSVALGSPQMNPVVYCACMRKSLTPESFRRHRFNCFRMHYQFVMAVDRLVPCDYAMIVAGPASLEMRGMDPQAAMEMCHGPDAWSGSQDELRPWLPLPRGRAQAFARSVNASQQAAIGKTLPPVPIDASERKSLVSNILALLLAFVVGLAAAELPPSLMEPPTANHRSADADSQLDTDEVSAGPDEVVSSPPHRRPA